MSPVTNALIFSLKGIAIATTLTLLPASAQEGAGSRGGNTLDVNGTERLFDLVTRAKCEWKNGDEVFETTPKLSTILKALEKLDWYFAFTLEREIRSLTYCFTGRLFWINPSDFQAPIAIDIRELRRTKQAGIRVNDEVYIDSDLYVGLKKSGDDAYFIIHEAIHRFFSGNLPGRKHKLPSMVNSIRDVREGRITSSNKLHELMRINGLIFPTNSHRIQAHQKALRYVLATESQRLKQIRSSKTPEQLVEGLRPEKINFALVQEDKIVNPLSMLEGDIRLLLTEGSMLDFNEILFEKKFTRIDLSMLLISAYDDLPPQKRAMILSFTVLEPNIKHTLQKLESITPILGKHQLLASVELQTLATERPELPRGIAALKPRGRTIGGRSALPYHIEALAKILVLIIQAEDWNLVQKLFTHNPKFYSSFGLKKLRADIRTLKYPDAALSESVVAEVSQGLLKEWLETVNTQLSQEQVERLKNEINFKNFE